MTTNAQDPAPKTRSLSSALLLGLLVSVAGAWLLTPGLSEHGLEARRGSSAVRIEDVALLTSNDDGELAPVFPVQWTGYLYIPESTQVVFRLPRSVVATFQLDGQVVFDTRASAMATNDEVPVRLTAGAHSLLLQFAEQRDKNVYLQDGLEWHTALGWRLVPALYLYSRRPDPQEAARSILLGRLAAIAGWVGAGCALGLVGVAAWNTRSLFRSRAVWGLALIVGLALLLRLLVLHDLARSPLFDILESGSDQRSYQRDALNALRGAWPEGAFYFKPGVSLLLAWLYSLAGPSLRAAETVQMALGALAVFVVFDVGRQIFNPLAGWIAALLWAIFPYPIFYEAFVLTHGLEAVAGICLLWLWLKILKRPSWSWVALCGAWLGAMAVLRPTFLAFVPLVALSLLWGRPASWPMILRRGAVLVGATALPILPITWHNYQASQRFQLISVEGPETLYLGNNRDSSGYGEPSIAQDVTDILVRQGKSDYTWQTLEDIRANPLRWLQLTLRKTAFLLSDYEVPNNADFNLEGIRASPVLAALPVRYGGMLALAMTGTLLALGRWRAWDESLWALLIYVAANSLLFITFVVLSRLRAPLYPALTILAGAAGASFVTALRQRQWQAAALMAVVLAANRLAISKMLFVADHVMSLPVVATLPSMTTVINAPVSDGLIFVGYDPLPVARPGEPAVVTVYWQSHGPLSTDLMGTLQAFADAGLSQKIAQDDHFIGAGAFPRYLTSQWQPGQIVRDQYLLDVPSDAPEPAALTILVAAYDKASGRRAGELTFGPLPLTRAEKVAVPSDAQPVGAKIGNATLTAYQLLPARAAELGLKLYWQVDRPMAADGVVFVHVFSMDGKLVASQDGRPRNGTYSTLAWQPGEVVVDEHSLSWPANTPTAEYRVTVGMYDATTQDRLLVSNSQAAADNVLTLATVQH